MLLALTLAAIVTGGATAEPSPFAVTGARIHPISGPVIEDGVLLVDGETIVTLGPASGIAIPPDHTVIDAAGLDLWERLESVNDAR